MTGPDGGPAADVARALGTSAEGETVNSALREVLDIRRRYGPADGKCQ
ncbi:hypothetical protein [Streptomyces sp. NPDC007088]